MAVDAEKRGLKIDIGCGARKRAGFVGLDFVAGPGVDHVLDLTKDRYPFGDKTVSHVFSAHFLEHIRGPNHVFTEISRICEDGARIEFWTPYAFTNEAFLYGHLTFLTEEAWLHYCCSQRDAHLGILGGRWLLRTINWVVSPQVERELASKGFSMDFSIRYLRSVVTEFGVEIEFRRDLATPAAVPTRTYSYSRYGPRFALTRRGHWGGRLATFIRLGISRLLRS